MSSLLKQNTEAIQSLLNTINSLPEASDAEDLNAVLTEQETLIAELQAILAEKASSGGAEDLNAVLNEQEELIATLQEMLAGKVSGGLTIANATAISQTGVGNRINFTGLIGEPKMFSICPKTTIPAYSSIPYIVNVQYDGSVIRASYADSTRVGSVYGNAFTKVYMNGTLIITSPSADSYGEFCTSIQYELVYVV